MFARNRRSALLRQARFESFEERLALSAQPVADFYLTSQVEQRIEMHLEQLEQHVEEFQDLDNGLADEIAHRAGQLEQHLGDVHSTTGVNYVYSTYGFTGAGQTVAVIDSGIAWDHVALGGGFGTNSRVIGGWDFAENDADPYDDGPSGFHGTHVAGIIGSDNSTYRGVAPGVDLVGLRVFDDNGAGYFNWVESALQWVHDHRNDFANPITTVNMSLGTAWNSNSVPNWSTIENELAQLEQDGIFIAVSAGNSFADYNTPGLSYPAASPYVVPVASATNAGSFSSFSQRHDRVIAAPGSSITSTVPDYLFGADGNPNDYGTASGTSMASPYVAGASVVIRQAMEFIGMQNITQDSIYDHIRNTADIFYDAATNANYRRLNVQAAIDALMPDDDYGDSAATS
ncbi:MAG: S8 family serine peptidase, partial [Planctomycetia bacterium]|nr:S8 family serine peptidase [Planctomycetia bacterium]